jgi:hypothetical protein
MLTNCPILFGKRRSGENHVRAPGRFGQKQFLHNQERGRFERAPGAVHVVELRGRVGPHHVQQPNGTVQQAVEHAVRGQTSAAGQSRFPKGVQVRPTVLKSRHAGQPIRQDARTATTPRVAVG